MSKLKQDKVHLTQDENNNLHFDAGNLEKVLFHDPYANYPYKLVRERDGLTKYGREIGWIEWGDNDRFKEKHDEPAVGRSCMLDPHRMSFTWLTTSITEIVASSEDGSYIKFNTENSTYELYRL